MKTACITFDIPENLLVSLNQDKEEFTKQTRLFIALQLFRSHKATFGQAAEIAGLDKQQMLSELDKNGIDFIDYDPSEIDEELKVLRNDNYR